MKYINITENEKFVCGPLSNNPAFSMQLQTGVAENHPFQKSRGTKTEVP